MSEPAFPYGISEVTIADRAAVDAIKAISDKLDMYQERSSDITNSAGRAELIKLAVAAMIARLERDHDLPNLGQEVNDFRNQWPE